MYISDILITRTGSSIKEKFLRSLYIYKIPSKSNCHKSYKKEKCNYECVFEATCKKRRITKIKSMYTEIKIPSML